MTIESGGVTTFGWDGLKTRLPNGEIVTACPQLLRQGDVVSIVGANGSGKSSFLASLFGLRPIMSGIVIAGGQLLTRPMSAQLSMLGIRYRSSRLLIDSTIGVHDLFEADPVRGRSGVDAELGRELIETFPEIGKWRDRKLSSLSGGEGRLMYLLSAFQKTGGCFLCDEIAACLSPEYCLRLLEWVNRARKAYNMSLVVVDNHSILDVLNPNIRLRMTRLSSESVTCGL